MDKLTRGERIVGASALALLVLSFVPLWAKAEGLGQSARGGGWSLAAWSKLAFLFALIALIVVAVRAFSTATLPFPAGVAYIALGALTTLFLVIQLLTGVPGAEELEGLGGLLGEDLGFEISRGPLLLIAWIFGLGILAGGFLHKQDEGAPAAGGTLGGPPMGGGPSVPPPTPPPAS